jgi:lipoprotein-anchoring transpeptidase ErfK/SrfK
MRSMRRLGNRLFALALATILSSCVTKDTTHLVLVSIANQTMDVYDRNFWIARYPVSTSKYGLSDLPGSRGTPLGRLEIAKKIGTGAQSGAVFKSRRPTGEILFPNAPGRDPIVTRILWLKGLEAQNRNAFSRYIYIHGTPVERDIGRPVSFGCIRMRSADVMQLFNTVGVGARVDITPGPLPDPNPASQVSADRTSGRGS